MQSVASIIGKGQYPLNKKYRGGSMLGDLSQIPGSLLPSPFPNIPTLMSAFSLDYCQTSGTQLSESMSICLKTQSLFPWIKDSKKSQKHGNHGSRDFCQMLPFCQNAMFCHVFSQNALILLSFHASTMIFHF